LNKVRLSHGTFISPHYATNYKVSGLSPDEVDFFQFTYSFQQHCGPRVNIVSKRNEYQESSWRVKVGRCIGLTTLPPSVSQLARQNVEGLMSYTLSFFTII
jgi:hypothetical protein